MQNAKTFQARLFVEVRAAANLTTSGKEEMIEKAKIKVIKKADAKPAQGKRKRTKTPPSAARDIVSTVSDWVSDLKERKSEETRAGFDRLFNSNPRPNES